MFKSVIHHRPFDTETDIGEIQYGLRFIPGNALPYFAVTISGKMKGQRHSEYGGCNHELVAEVAPDPAPEVAPDLAPLIALHGSTSDGVPMHAEANGWYWMAGHLGGLGQTHHACNGSFPKTADQALEIFARHARVSLNEARGLAVALLDTLDREGPHATRQAFSIWIAHQRPRWKAEAEKAITDFNLSDFNKG